MRQLVENDVSRWFSHSLDRHELFAGSNKAFGSIMKITLKIITILGVALLLSCGLEDIRGKGFISITTQPTGCEVYLDGELQPDTTNCVVDSVIKGQVLTLRLVKGDYLDYSDTVKVSGIDTLKLDFKFTGKLKVSSNPSGASIILDGEATFKVTPHTFDSVVVGSHSLRLEYEGYASVDTTVGVFYEEQTDVSTVLNQQFGYIQVNSTPAGATIWLDGSNTGYTTNCFLQNVGVGSHTVKLTKSGYVDWEQTVTVSEGQTTTINANLTQVTSKIQVNSTPTGAIIYLDGSNTGKTTNALLDDVAVGSHTVKLVKSGYADWDTTIIVSENETTTVDATLEVELKYDEVTHVLFGFKMKAGNRMAVEFTPGDFGSNMYPFELTGACYFPLGWADDPYNWDEACYLVFFGDGAEPGAELGRKEVAAVEKWAFNWFDVSDLDITIESGSFYFAVENKVDDNPGLSSDGQDPEHHVSWMYTIFQGETEPKWVSFDDIDAGFPGGMSLGDSVDLILRVKGLVPGGAEVVLTPTLSVSRKAPSSSYNATLPADQKSEILDWRVH